MKVQLIEYKYEKGTPGVAITGYPGGRRPEGLSFGSNGTYRLPSNPPKILATLRDIDTGKTGVIDLYRAVKTKFSLTAKNVTESSATDFLNKLKEAGPFTLSHAGDGVWLFV